MNLLITLLVSFMNVYAYIYIGQYPWVKFKNSQPIIQFFSSLFLAIIASASMSFINIHLFSTIGIHGSFLKTFIFQSNYHIPLLMGVGYIISEWKNTEVLRKTAQQEAEYNEKMLLQAVLNAHVIYNTLSTIIAINEKNPSEGTRCLYHISEFYRELTDASGREDFTFGEEKKLIDKYLFIEQKRLGQRLKITWDWDETLNNYQMPALIIQTLIENAIKHGISTAIQGGEITVRLFASSSQICIEIKNTGTPLAPSNRSGVGITNLQARLEYAFEKGAALRLYSELGWTIATISIDKKFIKEKQAPPLSFLQRKSMNEQVPLPC